jgi:hypothetical protein
MGVHFTSPSLKVEKADLQIRGNTAVRPHPAKTPRGQRRALKKK